MKTNDTEQNQETLAREISKLENQIFVLETKNEDMRFLLFSYLLKESIERMKNWKMYVSGVVDQAAPRPDDERFIKIIEALLKDFNHE